ncbi:hypothetical protein Cgig2_025142 [Carnegiea gigantea]|uniref:BHLH domain-containing protein n=1 Tax=Carnegiea gigantea TaxID=171969 RepID=A0A9Q1KST1_9CARY|nr:hypothetical protein Cgig2_025142 [Carnegiea gigantea]
MNNSENPQSDQIGETQQHQSGPEQINTAIPINNPYIQTLIQQNPTLEMQHYHQQPPPPDPSFLGRAGLVYPDLSAPPLLPPQPPIFPWNFPTTPHPDPFLLPSSSTYAGLFTRRPSSSLQFTYDGTPSDHLRLLSEALGPAGPFGLQAELNKMTAQEIMDAKALAASKSHSEAERRRRERINNHFAKLRSLLPSTTKTDKASLLAEVIQHVKELRRQTSAIAETTIVPTEADELTVDPASDGQDGKFIIKTSICCDDRSDLLPDLIKALKSLRLKTLKAEITTLGGRVKNVLFVTHEPTNDSQDDGDNQQQQPICSISSIEEALKAVMEKSGGGDESTSGNAKRQRTASINIS